MIDHKYYKTNLILQLQEGLENIFDEAVIGAIERQQPGLSPAKRKSACKLM